MNMPQQPQQPQAPVPPLSEDEKKQRDALYKQSKRVLRILAVIGSLALLALLILIATVSVAEKDQTPGSPAATPTAAGQRDEANQTTTIATPAAVAVPSTSAARADPAPQPPPAAPKPPPVIPTPDVPPPPRSICTWIIAAAPAVVATLAGLLGACITAGMSAAGRRADGWEFEDGTKYPPNETHPDRFSRRIAPYFLVRPIVGAAFGFFAYAALASGTLIVLSKPQQTNGSPATGTAQVLALAAVGFLFGLFSKTLHDKLKEGFKAFVDTESKK
jgi:hypothetical protein